MKVCCVFSLESPHRRDSNEYTQYTIFDIKKENHPTLSQICSHGILFQGTQEEFETAMVNEPSVFAIEVLLYFILSNVYIDEGVIKQLYHGLSTCTGYKARWLSTHWKKWVVKFTNT